MQTPAKHSLLMHCHMLRTNPKSKRTEWLGLTREFNLAVSRSWQQTHELADTFLKHESHLKQCEKQLVMQASLAEVAQTSSAISCLQANPGPSHGAAQAPSAWSAFCFPTQGLQLGQGNAYFCRPRGGRGGPGGSRKCERCSSLFDCRVPEAGHNCFFYMCVQGCNAEQLARQGFTDPPVSKAEAEEGLRKNIRQAEAQKKRRMQ